MLCQNSFQETKYRTGGIRENFCLILLKAVSVSSPSPKINPKKAALVYSHKDQLEPSLQPFPLIGWGSRLQHLSHRHPETAGQYQEPKETHRIPFQRITLQLSAATSARVKVHKLDTWCDTAGGNAGLAFSGWDANQGHLTDPAAARKERSVSCPEAPFALERAGVQQ